MQKATQKIQDTAPIWAQHGFRLERVQQAMGSPVRNVYGPDGALVLEDTDLEAELEYLEQHSMCGEDLTATPGQTNNSGDLQEFNDFNDLQKPET